MDMSVPPPNEWSLGDTDLTVWSLGQTTSGPAYALIAPSGWVRLALAAPNNGGPPLDWTEARQLLDDELDALPTPVEGWEIVAAVESEREVVEFGPLSPAPDAPVVQGQLLNATVFSVNARGEFIGWLVADMDSMDAALILPWEYADDPAWRAAARQASLVQLSHLPSRARWRLRIAAEEAVDVAVLPGAAEPESRTAAATPPPPVGPRPGFRPPSLGAAAGAPRRSLISIAVILGLCVVLALALNLLRNRASGPDVPALNMAAVTLVPPKVGGDALVTATRLTPLRREPNNQAPVILLVAEGQTMTVAEGPRAEGGVNWWRVNVGQQTGWLPETLPDGTKIFAGRQ